MNTKNILKMAVSLFLAIVLCLPAVLPVCAATPGLSITAPSSVKPGETFTVGVHVNDNPGIASWRITLKYDTSKLELVSAGPGEKMESKGVVINTDQGNKPISSYTEVIGYCVAAKNSKATGEYITATFKVLSSAPETGVYFTAFMDECINQSYETE